MKRSLSSLLTILAVLGLLLSVGSGAANAQAAKTPAVWPSADIKWVDNPAVSGAKIAVLWGDPKTGAYGALKKLPAGKTLALHTHSQDQKVLCISGTIVMTLEGAAGKELAAGSYAFIPGGAKHTASCKTGAECTYFEEQPGPSDINFVDKK